MKPASGYVLEIITLLLIGAGRCGYADTETPNKAREANKNMNSETSATENGVRGPKSYTAPKTTESQPDTKRENAGKTSATALKSIAAENAVLRGTAKNGTMLDLEGSESTENYIYIITTQQHGKISAEAKSESPALRENDFMKTESESKAADAVLNSGRERLDQNDSYRDGGGPWNSSVLTAEDMLSQSAAELEDASQHLGLRLVAIGLLFGLLFAVMSIIAYGTSIRRDREVDSVVQLANWCFLVSLTGTYLLHVRPTFAELSEDSCVCYTAVGHASALCSMIWLATLGYHRALLLHSEDMVVKTGTYIFQYVAFNFGVPVLVVCVSFAVLQEKYASFLHQNVCWLSQKGVFGLLVPVGINQLFLSCITVYEWLCDPWQYGLDAPEDKILKRRFDALKRGLLAATTIHTACAVHITLVWRYTTTGSIVIACIIPVVNLGIGILMLTFYHFTGFRTWLLCVSPEEKLKLEEEIAAIETADEKDARVQKERFEERMRNMKGSSFPRRCLFPQFCKPEKPPLFDFRVYQGPSPSTSRSATHKSESSSPRSRPASRVALEESPSARSLASSEALLSPVFRSAAPEPSPKAMSPRSPRSVRESAGPKFPQPGEVGDFGEAVSGRGSPVPDTASPKSLTSLIRQESPPVRHRASLSQPASPAVRPRTFTPLPFSTSPPRSVIPQAIATLHPPFSTFPSPRATGAFFPPPRATMHSPRQPLHPYKPSFLDKTFPAQTSKSTPMPFESEQKLVQKSSSLQDMPDHLRAFLEEPVPHIQQPSPPGQMGRPRQPVVPYYRVEEPEPELAVQETIEPLASVRRYSPPSDFTGDFTEAGLGARALGPRPQRLGTESCFREVHGSSEVPPRLPTQPLGPPIYPRVAMLGRPDQVSDSDSTDFSTPEISLQDLVFSSDLEGEGADSLKELMSRLHLSKQSK